jgi:CRISPR-associated protein Cmx8
MAKAKQEEPTHISLTYTLAELPSAQHRAGLAGLVMMLQWLNKERRESDERRIVALGEGGIQVSLSQAGLIELMDAFYDAVELEVGQQKPRKGKGGGPDPTPKRVEQRVVISGVKKEPKEVPYYIYPDMKPRGAFLEEWAPRSEGGELWIKLWRDMIYAIVRGVPTQRGPYERRAAGVSSGEGERIWAQLSGKKADGSDALASTFYLGVQATNAEGVAFRDRVRELFLLHFWPLAVQVYVPSKMERQPDGGWRPTLSRSYALAIPDVSSLINFCEQYERLMCARACDRRAYRPAQAVVDLPAEGALAFMQGLGELVAGDARAQRRTILGVEVIHAEKEGNNIVIKGFRRVEPGGVILARYAQIRESCWDLNVRRMLIENLLEERSWLDGFARWMSVQDTKLTIERTSFQHDARSIFTQRQEDSVDGVTEELKNAIWWTVKGWIHARVAKRDDKLAKVTRASSEKEKHAYNAQAGKAAMEAFYAARSRTGRDFADYFVTTLCAVPQSMGQGRYVELSSMLLSEEGCEVVRALTLLALSAQGRPFYDVDSNDDEHHDNAGADAPNDEE